MTGNRTHATDASVERYLDARASAAQRADCQALMDLFGAITGEAPRMWGPSIVGYGAYRYTYASGRSGEAPLAGFAIRGREIVVYLDCEDAPRQQLLARLGPHRIGSACLYFKRLDDLDAAVLEQLVRDAIAAVRQRYG